MKIFFDWDGTVVDGQNLPDISRNECYAGVGPYDQDTHWVWDQLCEEHEVYVITARACPDALRGIVGWLQYRDWRLPKGVFTGVRNGEKWRVVSALLGDYFFDDRVDAVEPALRWSTAACYLMHNPHYRQTIPPDIRGWLQIKEIIDRKETADDARIYS